MHRTLTDSNVYINGRNIRTFVLSSSKKNPIIFFIHGGPGYGTSYSLSKTFLDRCPNLIEKYTIIFWDQRCAGDSLCIKDLFIPSSIDDYLSDTKLLCDFFLKKFEQKKLILTGHSWGSILGLKVASQWPQITLGYIGMGQIINGLEGELLSYQYALRKTQKHNYNLNNILKKDGPPPHNKKDTVPYLIHQREILSSVGGFEKSRAITSFPRKNTLIGKFIFSLRIKIGMYLSVRRVWSSCLDTNFNVLPDYLPFPVIFICGRYDFITPTSLVISFYKKIKSPKKIHIFGKSGHRPHLEELMKFADILDKEVELLTRNK